MAQHPPQRQLADLILSHKGVKLDELVASQRGQQVTWREISDYLQTCYDVSVPFRTLHRWYADELRSAA